MAESEAQTLPIREKAMPTEERLALITENLAEVLNIEIIEKVFAEGRDPKIYWGTATTGRPHCGYFVPFLKIAQFLAAGCEVTILFADIHGFLDNLKAPIEIVQHRVEYYRFVVINMLKAVGITPTGLEKLKFKVGSDYQLSPDYQWDTLRMASLVTEHDAKKAGAEIVKQSGASMPLSGLLYPILQVLDEQHLGVDIQFGGVDQRKLFTAAKEWLPRLGYKERAHLMNVMVPSFSTGGKMSSSDADSKIDLLDPPNVVDKKIKKGWGIPKETENNPLLAFTEHVLLPSAALRGKREFIVERRDESPLIYDNIEKMTEDYKNDVLTPQFFKPAISREINRLLAPIQEAYEASKEWQDVTLKAYPPPAKKEKKVKKLGTGYPGPKKEKEDTKPAGE